VSQRRSLDEGLPDTVGEDAPVRQSMIRERLPEARRSPIPPPPPEGSLPLRPSRLPLSPHSPRDEAQALVHRLVGCGPEGVARPMERLLELGELALDVLARAFPGPLWPTAQRIPGTEFRTRSAVAAVLVAFGEAAWPHVEWLMQAPTLRVRVQACELVAALPRPELMEALTTAALDTERDVRAAAQRILASLTDTRSRELARLGLRSHLAPHFESKLRRRALDALVELRDAASASCLIELLADGDRVLARRAHLGLRLITGHDFGNLRDGWTRWHTTHGARSRADWLRSGLEDRRPELAELACSELAALEAE